MPRRCQELAIEPGSSGLKINLLLIVCNISTVWGWIFGWLVDCCYFFTLLECESLITYQAFLGTASTPFHWPAHINKFIVHIFLYLGFAISLYYFLSLYFFLFHSKTTLKQQVVLVVEWNYLSFSRHLIKLRICCMLYFMGGGEIGCLMSRIHSIL